MISDNFVTIDGLKICFDFIATPTIEARKATVRWKHFFKRVPWDSQQQPAPPKLAAMEVTPGVIYFYTPIAPFDLSEDECFSWLDWHVFTMVNGNDIHVLRTRDPTLDTSKSNSSINREIGSCVNHGDYYNRTPDSDEESASKTNRRRPSTADNTESPVTKRYLRDALDTQTDRFIRELNRHANRFNYNNNNNLRRANYVQQTPASTTAPSAAPLSIPATPAGNNINLNQMTTDEIINWLRSRDK